MLSSAVKPHRPSLQRGGMATRWGDVCAEKRSRGWNGFCGADDPLNLPNPVVCEEHGTLKSISRQKRHIRGLLTRYQVIFDSVQHQRAVQNIGGVPDTLTRLHSRWQATIRAHGFHWPKADPLSLRFQPSLTYRYGCYKNLSSLLLALQPVLVPLSVLVYSTVGLGEMI